ncbi:MAG TPA: adenylate/guanylate cyclase domain-containing protein [Beijerinckiaceae bacterium]|jgi:adenylate cyclase
MADSAVPPVPARPSPTLPDGPDLPSTLEELRALLAEDQDRLAAASRVRTWLFEEARARRDTTFFLAGLCEHLNGAGVPIDRGSLALETLHSEHAAIGRFWVKGEGSHSEKFRYDREDQTGYQRSPFYHVHQTRRPLTLDLARTPDEAFGVVSELKEAGYTGYVCFPIFFANGDENGIAFATKHPGGFSRLDLATTAFVMPAASAVLEILAGYRSLDQLLRIYVGDEPHRAILSGRVRRGDVTTIRSAILVGDMRNYTRITANMRPEESVELLNAYFDCLVPPVEAEGGEVLKYMGDGLLAIFRETGDDLGGAAQSALSAASAALARIEAANLEGRFPVPIDVGIALHHGEAAYGNVGSGERLDFTIIGRDVNLASRIAQLNKALGEPLLMSRAFVEFLWGDPEPLGSHDVNGFEEAIAVYRPRAPDAPG